MYDVVELGESVYLKKKKYKIETAAKNNFEKYFFKPMNYSVWKNNDECKKLC